MIELFLKLLLAHIIGDFVFQSNRCVQDKETHKIKSKSLYLHVLIHAVALVICLLPNADYWAGILFILASHYLIDLLKLYLDQKLDKRILFFVDQIAHLLMIALVVRYYEPFQMNIEKLMSPQILLLLLSVLACTHVASVVMKLLLSKWEDELIDKGNTAKEESTSLTNAGIYIGILERLFIFFFVISQQYSGIGFLLAAKSVFRFGDLSHAKNRKLTEYILIGTLLTQVSYSTT